MTNRVTYFVTPRDNGEWAVLRAGASRASEIVSAKPDAVKRAKELAKQHELSQVVIQKGDGEFQTEHTYGKDPEKYPG